LFLRGDGTWGNKISGVINANADVYVSTGIDVHTKGNVMMVVSPYRTTDIGYTTNLTIASNQANTGWSSVRYFMFATNGSTNFNRSSDFTDYSAAVSFYQVMGYYIRIIYGILYIAKQYSGLDLFYKEY
jgi:hypothetical protein